MIKRYDCAIDHEDGYDSCAYMDECHLGEYVLFDDHESAIAAKDAEIAAEKRHRLLLQKALMFWLPMVPESPEDVSNRAAHDAYLLMGYEGEDEPSAEKLGWISLAPPVEGWTEVLDEIDRKALAGLCCFNFDGARSFLKDIRAIVAEHNQEVKPKSDKGNLDVQLGEVSPDRSAG